MSTEIATAKQIGCELARELERIEARHQQQVSVDATRADVTHVLDRALLELGATGLVGPANRMPSNAFWQEAERWLRHGTLQLHARTKPRGYAGDYQLLEKICGNECCHHALGNAMDYYFQNQAAPRAVRTRTALVAERIVRRCQQTTTGPCRVVCVGSGPAYELRQAAQVMNSASAALQVTLIDMDQKALDFSQQALRSWLRPDAVVPVRANLSRLAQNRELQQLVAAGDYVYCPGFFDYLDAEAAAANLQLLHSWLAPGGELTVFNFATTNASRAYMEWIGNWYLTYRSLADMERLTAVLPVRSNTRVASIADDTLIELTITR